MKIRKFRKEDAKKASSVIRRGWKICNAKCYSKASIAEQSGANSPGNLLKKAENVKYFVAVTKNEILGIGGYDTERVQTLFIDPEYQGKGIGRKLIERILSEAKRDGLRSLDCWSTLQAEKFYARFGFERIKAFTLHCRRSSINFVLMRKRLKC